MYADTSYGALAGRVFIKEEVYHALGVGHSQSSSDASLFKDSMLKRLPKIAAWFKDPEGPYAAKFADMSVPAFKKYQSSHTAQISASVKGNNKRAHDDDEGESQRKKRKQKDKGKGKEKEVTSDHLDTSEPESD